MIVFRKKTFSDDEDYSKKGAAIGAGVGLGLTGAIGTSAYLGDKKLRQSINDALESAEKDSKEVGKFTEETKNKLAKVADKRIYHNKKYLDPKNEKTTKIIQNAYNDFTVDFANFKKPEIISIVGKKLGIDTSKPDWMKTVKKDTELAKKFDEEFNKVTQNSVSPMVDNIIKGKSKKNKDVFDYYLVRNGKDDLINDTLLSKIKRNKLATAGIAGAGILGLAGAGYGLGKLKKRNKNKD